MGHTTTTTTAWVCEDWTELGAAFLAELDAS